MKYLKTYNQILEGKAEKKALKKIQKFFKDDFITKKAIDISPKLSIWMVNQVLANFEDILYDATSAGESAGISKEELEQYFKTGKDELGELIKIDKLIRYYWNNHLSSKFQSIVDWVQSPDISPEDKENLTKMSLSDAYDKSVEWHDSLKAGGIIEDEHGKIIMSFPDGFYWIDLETSTDRDEADAMGHCGNTNKGDTLYSLRDRKKSPHVTAAIDSKEGIVYQMKGRNNKKPIDKYHTYIVDLLMNDDLEPPLKGLGAEYNREDDFNPEEDLTKELYDKLKEKRPDIDTPVWDKEDINRMFDDMLGSYYLEDPDAGWNAISWAYALIKEDKGIDPIIDSLQSHSDILFDILCKEHPEKTNYNLDDMSYKEKEIFVNDISASISADDIAKDQNINILNPKASNKEKWYILINEIDDDVLKKILIDNGMLSKGKVNTKDNLELKFEAFNYTDRLKDQFYKTNYYGTKFDSLDYEEIIRYFIGYDDDEIWEEFKYLFEYNGSKSGKYYSDTWYVFDTSEIALIITSNTTIEEKEDELSTNGYWEYIGDY